MSLPSAVVLMFIRSILCGILWHPGATARVGPPLNPLPWSSGEGHNTKTIGTSLREYLKQEWLCKARYAPTHRLSGDF